MYLIDFIKMQNREMVECGKITFKLLLSNELGGKWFFYCEKGETIETLCKWVEDNNLNIDISYPNNQFDIEEEFSEDKNGNPINYYVFVFDKTM